MCVCELDYVCVCCSENVVVMVCYLLCNGKLNARNLIIIHVILMCLSPSIYVMCAVFFIQIDTPCWLLWIVCRKHEVYYYYHLCIWKLWLRVDKKKRIWGWMERCCQIINIIFSIYAAVVYLHMIEQRGSHHVNVIRGYFHV